MQHKIPRSSNLDHEEMRHSFLDQMDRLLLPAYLLTGSHEQAAECFLEAWNVCSEQSPQKAGYALRVAKRTVIKAAIGRIATDVLANATKAAVSACVVAANAYPELRSDMKPLSSEAFCQAVLSLNAFHRAVLVLRLYERYSTVDVALLLGVSRRTLDYEWQRALIELSDKLDPVDVRGSGMFDTAGVIETDQKQPSAIPF